MIDSDVEYLYVQMSSSPGIVRFTSVMRLIRSDNFKSQHFRSMTAIFSSGLEQLRDLPRLFVIFDFRTSKTFLTLSIKRSMQV